MELAGFEESRGVPECSSEVVLWGGVGVTLCSAFLAELRNVYFGPMRSGMLSVFSVVAGLPLLSALWGTSVVCAKMVGRAVVLRRVELEERPQESSEFVASGRGLCLPVGWLCGAVAAAFYAAAVAAGVRERGL